jgi:hypothetical protein
VTSRHIVSCVVVRTSHFVDAHFQIGFRNNVSDKDCRANDLDSRMHDVSKPVQNDLISTVKRFVRKTTRRLTII